MAGAASLVCPDISGNIPFRLLNPTDNPVTVFRGATLGHLTTSGFDISPSHSCTPPPCATLPTTTQQETHDAIINPMCSKAFPPPMDPSLPSAPHHNPTADPLDLSQSVLSQPEKQALSELLTEYVDILPQSTTSLGRTNLVQHKMDVSLLPPTNLSPSVAEHRARIVQTLEETKQLIQSNTQRAQLKMKARYDQSASPIQYMIGQRMWVYTPKHRKELSKKLLHNYHGPFRIVAKLSPVHFKLRTLENKPVSAPVHANRLKPYFEPKDRPIEAPQEDPPMANEPYLRDDDLPADSFPSPVSREIPDLRNT